MANTLDIASKTRRIDVDNRLALRFYYRTASHLLRQASVYRDESNVIDLYILLLRFSSLVSETIPDHRDYRTTAPKEKAEFKSKLREVVGELERLKPEFQKQVDKINKVHQLPPPSAGASEWANFTSNWPSAPLNAVRIEQNVNRDRPRIGSKEYFEPAVGSSNSSSSPSTVSSSSSSSAVSSLDNQFGGLSLNLPRPRDETLSRHSIFGPSVQQRPNSAVPFRAQYPSYINASPIEMPSYEQRWGGPPMQHVVPNHSSPIQSSAEPVLWPEADNHFPETYTPFIGPDLAPVPSLIRQPDPPPVRAPVQTLESLDYARPQLPPERVADPRPGSAPSLADDMGHEKGTKHLHISTRMMDEFLALSGFNTQQNLETCAILAGSLKNGVFYVNALIVPKQEATSDSCQTVNEEEIFDVQDKRGLFQLGWIHTHPTQTCFMSSIDLHTHYSYQIMLNEAIAIVMAPTDTQRGYGIFRLSEPGGIKSIQQCDRRGFHPHEQTEDGSPIYEHCGHVFMSPKLRFDVIDLRNT